MTKRIAGRFFCAALLVVFLLSPFAASLSGGQAGLKGNIIGFLYDRDGTTPLEGAVVKFKSLTSGTIYESTKSDTYGIFKVQEVESGVYTYGVATEQGDFNADNIVGFKVSENETAKLSISVNPYEKEVAAAVSEIYKDQETNGETLVGTIADFNPNSRLAQVQIVKGMLRVEDRIHAKGKSTNFYQDVDTLMVGNNSARQVLKGQTGTLKLERNAKSGDLVYVVRAKNLFPIFLAPLGVAAVIGGNEAVTYGIIKIKDQQHPVSAKRDN